jgi:hypothetical protein
VLCASVDKAKYFHISVSVKLKVWLVTIPLKCVSHPGQGSSNLNCSTTYPLSVMHKDRQHGKM